MSVTAASAVAIVLLGPNHVALQNASDAAAFVALLEEPGRHLAAAAADVVFAVAYGLLGVFALELLGRGQWWIRLAQALIAVGAASDVVENVFLMRNIAARSSLTDEWVDAMQVPGTLKWLAAPGFLVLFGLLAARLVRRPQR